MAHPRDRKLTTRKRILEAAARLFAAQGFKGTSIAAVMAQCGLTSGGFYAHFDSKAQLYKEAMARALSGQRSISSAVRNASAKHQDGARSAPSLPNSFLAADIGSDTPEVREAYALALRSLQQQLETLSSPAPSANTYALAAAVMVVGSQAINRTVDDIQVKESVANACREAMLKLLEPDRPCYFWSLDDRPKLSFAAA